VILHHDDAALDRRIIRGSAWVAASYGGRHLATLIATLVLVRLLDPAAFGLVALAWVFIAALYQLEGAGIEAALVYRRDRLAAAASSAFVFAVFTGVVLYGISFAAAPLVARAFEAPALTDVLRVMGILILIRSLAVVPAALFERELDFRSRARCEVAGALAQVGVSIGLAIAGGGVWSLVFGQLAGTGVQTALFWALGSWRPQLSLASMAEIRDLVRYGRFVSATNVVNLANNTMDNLFVGRILGAGALGIYAVAFRLADFPTTVLGHVVGRVMFPVYSQLQADVGRVRRAYLRNLQRTALLAVPVSVGLAVAAEPVVLGLLGERWESAITPLRILAVYGIVKTIAAPAGEIFKGMGRPHMGFAFSAAQVAVLGVLLAVLTPPYGLRGAALAMLIAVSACGFAKLAASLRAVGATSGDLARALAAPALCSGSVALALTLLLPSVDSLTPLAALAVLTAAGVAVYAAAAAVFARGVVAPIWAGWRGAGMGAAR